MKKLLRNWSLLTISNLVYQIFIFLSFLRIAKVLEPELFGLFTIIITAVTIAQIFSSLGMHKIVIREIARETSLISHLARATATPLLLAFIVSNLLLLAYLLFFEGLSESTILIVASIILLSLSMWNFAEPLAFGLQNINISSYLNIASSMVFFGIVFFSHRV